MWIYYAISIANNKSLYFNVIRLGWLKQIYDAISFIRDFPCKKKRLKQALGILS